MMPNSIWLCVTKWVKGGEQSYEKAIYWYTKAAEQGYADAIHNLEKIKKKI